MKYLVHIFLFLFIASSSNAQQQFLWAKSYDIPNCNEVAALAADTNGNIFITGVYDTSPFVPYTGDTYILKTSENGEVLWTEYLSGTLQIGDLTTMNTSAVIIGQSNGPFTYKEQSYGPSGFFLFMMMIDADGNPEWEYFNETLYGTKANLSAGKLGTFAVHARGQSNLGDWIMIMNNAGDILDSKQLSASSSMIVDMTYYNNHVYLNGGFSGPGSVVIDTIVIEQPPVENASFVLALDEELVAEWVYIDTAFNNFDGRIVANNAGIFSYSAVLEPPFSLVTTLKKFSPEGELAGEVYVPLFSNAVALYPDMVVTPSAVALFLENAFNFDSHKLILLDFNLEVISEMVVDGSSDLYSGQVTNFGEDLFIAHVFSGQLNFNDELTLPYTGTGKHPYLARFGEPYISNTKETNNLSGKLLVVPNPASEHIMLSYIGSHSSAVKCRIFDSEGREKLVLDFPVMGLNINISSLGKGIYFAEVLFRNGQTQVTKFLVR